MRRPHSAIHRSIHGVRGARDDYDTARDTTLEPRAPSALRSAIHYHTTRTRYISERVSTSLVSSTHTRHNPAGCLSWEPHTWRHRACRAPTQSHHRSPLRAPTPRPPCAPPPRALAPPPTHGIPHGRHGGGRGRAAQRGATRSRTANPPSPVAPHKVTSCGPWRREGVRKLKNGLRRVELCPPLLTLESSSFGTNLRPWIESWIAAFDWP